MRNGSFPPSLCALHSVVRPRVSVSRAKVFGRTSPSPCRDSDVGDGDEQSSAQASVE